MSTSASFPGLCHQHLSRTGSEPGLGQAEVTWRPLYPAGRRSSRAKAPFAWCPRIFTSRGLPGLSGVHVGTH